MGEETNSSQTNPASKEKSIGLIFVTVTIPLVLRYIAGGAVMLSLWVLVHQKLMDSSVYLIYVSTIFTAIGVNHLVSKKDS